MRHRAGLRNSKKYYWGNNIVVFSRLSSNNTYCDAGDEGRPGQRLSEEIYVVANNWAPLTTLNMRANLKNQQLVKEFPEIVLKVGYGTMLNINSDTDILSTLGVIVKSYDQMIDSVF